MVPAPVTVSVLPVMLPGPLMMVKVTGLPEAPPVATSVMGETPKVTGEVGCVKVMVCAAGDDEPVAVPLRLMVCVLTVELSVKTSEPVRLPPESGSKSMATLQNVLRAIEPGEPAPLAVTGQVLLGSRAKLAEMAGSLPLPGIGKLSVALPMLKSVKFCGLSELVAPEAVVAKLADCGSATSSFSTVPL